MTRIAIIATLLGSSLFASEPQRPREAETFSQPGVLQFQGLTERDEVRIDGELVPAKGLALVKYKLLIAPGEYQVSVKLSSQSGECVSQVVVDPGETVMPRCVRPEIARLAD